MATATKTPSKRAASKTGAAAAVKSTRARNGSAIKAVPAAAKVAAKAGSAAKNTPVKRALNGASAHAPKLARGAKASRSTRVKNHAGNGAVPAELAGDVQELARVTQDGHEGEVVRKTRASSSAGGEAADVAELAEIGRASCRERVLMPV